MHLVVDVAPVTDSHNVFYFRLGGTCNHVAGPLFKMNNALHCVHPTPVHHRYGSKCNTIDSMHVKGIAISKAHFRKGKQLMQEMLQ